MLFVLNLNKGTFVRLRKAGVRLLLLLEFGLHLNSLLAGLLKSGPSLLDFLLTLLNQCLQFLASLLLLLDPVAHALLLFLQLQASGPAGLHLRIEPCHLGLGLLLNGLSDLESALLAAL